MIAWCRRTLFALVTVASMMACDPAAAPTDAEPASDGGPGGLDSSNWLPAQMCAPACSGGGPSAPPGYPADSTCYDGCNWCVCTTAGPVGCTARACSDAGVDGGA
ncbi:MAG: hypothetical protein KF729_06105 [Sandaracinaceae bacterium]|nr:hypothetical protein [Sandaracinaceae bacterium]